MPLIQRPGVALKLRDRYGLTSLPDSILAPELVPVVIVDDLSEEGQARRCFGRTYQGAVAGEVPMIMLGQSPGASDITMIVRRAWVRSGSNEAIIRSRITEAGYTWTLITVSKTFADLSTPGRPSGQIGIASSAVPVGKIDFGVSQDTALSTVEIPLNIIVRPSDIGVLFMGNVVNMSLDVSWEWDEIAPT